MGYDSSSVRNVSGQGLPNTDVSLRRFPYPFKAALTLCSDIDETKTVERFLAIQNFLNATEDEGMGPGLGLEIGNSFFPYTPDDSFAFFSSRSLDRDVIETLIHAGFIDCIHSFGDGIVLREDALRALDTFQKSGCLLDVWIDHARAPSNFGKDTTAGQGDVKTSSVYHADRTLAYGIKFVWKGRGSNMVGQGVAVTPASFARMVDRNHPAESATNIAKEALKLALGCAGNKRFAIHCGNPVMHVAHLSDGAAVHEFNRCNNYWRGLSYGHDSEGLAYVLRPRVLADLIRLEGYMIVYTHLGVGSARAPYLPHPTREALRSLADAYRRGDIYVTTTARLLRYHLNWRYLKWSAHSEAGLVTIRISGVDDPVNGFHVPTIAELQAITFYVPSEGQVRLFVGDRLIDHLVRNPPDDHGRASVTIPRTYLTYPLSALKTTIQRSRSAAGITHDVHSAAVYPE